MLFLVSVLVICLIWYFLKSLAHFSSNILKLVRKCSVYTRFLHRWIQSAPATFTYTAIFCAFTLVQHTTSSHLIEILTNQNSTNIARTAKQPIAMFFDSALWVADEGAGLVIYVLIFMIFIAWAERHYGTPRMIVIGACGHVIGSVLTILLEIWAINTHRAPSSLAMTTDVGVSYIMVAGCAAAILLMRKKALILGLLAIFAFIVIPIFFDRSIWDMGHFFATTIGFIVAGISLKLVPLRQVSSPLNLLAEVRAEVSKLS